MKKIVFILISVSLGILIVFLIIELIFRFYLFGFNLRYKGDTAVSTDILTSDKKQIFFVGDSFTRGYPYPVDQSYPLILEKKLNNRKIKINNFAFPAYDLYEQVNVIKKITEIFKPSLIVWGLSANDISTPGGEIESLDKLDTYKLRSFSFAENKINILKHALIDLPYDCIFNAKMSIFSTIKEILNNYSYAYMIVKSRLENNRLFRPLKAKPNKHIELEGVSSYLLKYYKNGVYPNHVIDAISYVKGYLAKFKIGFILLYVPMEADLNEEIFDANIKQFDTNMVNYNRKNPRVNIKSFCLRNNILFIDPSEYMEKELSKENLFLIFDRHYNRDGNIHFADFLSKNAEFLSKIDEVSAQ